MRIKPATVLGRLAFAIVAGVVFLALLLILEQVKDHMAEVRAQERLAVKWQAEISHLQEDQERLEAEQDRRLGVAYDWLSKAAIPREKILEVARRDAVAGGEFELDYCFASATLESDGWNVTCGSDLEGKYIHYVIDPLTGKISSKQGVKNSQLKP